jgi:RNA polymerase sigma-70 factor (family 1)
MNRTESDSIILQKIASGDQQAFRQLFDTFSKKLVHFSFAIVRVKDAALEVVDDVFVRLWKNRQHADQIQNISVYLYTAVKNTSLNYLAQMARQQVSESFDFIDIHLASGQSPEQRMITTEIFKKIQAAVEELPPRCKMIFKLVREDGLKYKEVAQILNVSVNTVDAQMVIAVKRISEKVKPHLDIFPQVYAAKKG